MSRRNLIIILVIGAYIIFNKTFQIIRIPPVSEGGLPVGEFLLIILFCFLIKDLKWFPAFTNNILFLVFLTWWSIGLSRALWAVPEYGIWALRDASHVIESLFLWVGFVFAGVPGAMDFLFIWLRRILGLGCLYAFTFPFRETIATVTPTVLNLEGFPIASFTTHSTSGICLLWEATRRAVLNTKANPLVLALLIVYAVAVFQARTIYLQLAAILLIIMWYRFNVFKKLGIALMAGFVIFVLVENSGIEIQGRKNAPISTDFVIRHIYSIAGIEGEGVVGSAKGVSQRFGWWEDIYEELVDSDYKFFFGMGYGEVLINFKGGYGQVVREPHNSLISTFGRLGLVGVLLIILGHVFLVRYWYYAFRLCRQRGYSLGQDRLIILLVYFVLVWVYSLGEDAFEKPYLIIPYYFFWGVVLQYRLQLMKEFGKTESITIKGFASPNVKSDNTIVEAG